MSLDAKLTSWASMRSDSQSTWRRMEARALMREALRVLKPFAANPGPAVAALTAYMSQGLTSPSDTDLRQHADRCVADLLATLLDWKQKQEVVLPVRYVSLSVEGHHHALCRVLSLASEAMCGDADAFLTFQRPPMLHATTLYVAGNAQKQELTRSVHLHEAAATFECTVTHVVCVPGALCFAVVDGEALRSLGVPLAQRAHITLCTRSPWKPRHSNDVLEAVASHLQDLESRWWRELRVAETLLDVFVYRLDDALRLPDNPLELQ